MHKQMIVFKNKRSLFAVVPLLTAIAILFAIVGVFGFGCDVAAHADVAGDPTTVYNRVLDASGDEYALPSNSWTYGHDIKIATPVLEHKDGASGKLNISLYLGDDLIAKEIEPIKLADYINKYMPAGKYKLFFAAPMAIADGITYEQKDYAFPFEVERAAMPQNRIELVSNYLSRNDAYEFMYDGNVHMLPADMDENIINPVGGVYERGFGTSVYWAKEAADKYFGGLKLLFNVSGMSNSHYHTAEYFAGEEEFVDCTAVAPCEPGVYTVNYLLSGDNFLDSEAGDIQYSYKVSVFGEVEIPVIQETIYDGTVQTANISDGLHYTVDAYTGWTDVGSHDITLRLREPECYLWKGQTLKTRTTAVKVKFTINKASNDWVQIPDVVRWVEGEYDPEENLVIGEALFGKVVFVITDADDNVVYNSETGVNKLGELKAGSYNFTASVEGTDNYTVLPYSKFIRVLEKQGLPWWGTMCIAIGAIAVVAIIILILYKTGVFRILTDKIVLSIRTKATIDATIAAVRANKRAEESRASREQAEARDRAAEQAAARKAAVEEARNRPPEEQVAELEAKAKAASEKADAMRERTDAMQERAEKFKAKVASDAAVAKDTASVAEERNPDETPVIDGEAEKAGDANVEVAAAEDTKSKAPAAPSKPKKPRSNKKKAEPTVAASDTKAETTDHTED